jgi:hypothetical protein
MCNKSSKILIEKKNLYTVFVDFEVLDIKYYSIQMKTIIMITNIII